MAGFEKDVLVYKDRVGKLELIRDDIKATREKIHQALLSIDESGKSIDLRLKGHSLNLEVLNFLNKLGAKNNLLDTDIEANLAASREIVEGLTTVLQDTESAISTHLGDSPDESIKAILLRQGIELEPESTAEIIQRAEKILAS